MLVVIKLKIACMPLKITKGIDTGAPKIEHWSNLRPNARKLFFWVGPIKWIH